MSVEEWETHSHPCSSIVEDHSITDISVNESHILKMITLCDTYLTTDPTNVANGTLSKTLCKNGTTS